MIIYSSNVMKYTPILLLSVLSVFLIPLLQTANAQNPLDQLIGGIKNITNGASKSANNTASQAGQSANKTASQAGQSANKTASQAGQSANKTASQAGQSANKTASQAGQSANKATNASTIQSNAASYPGNASNSGNNNLTKSNPIGGALTNTTKSVTDVLGKGISSIMNLGNNKAK
jgi:hypothetical protein